MLTQARAHGIAAFKTVLSLTVISGEVCVSWGYVLQHWHVIRSIRKLYADPKIPVLMSASRSASSTTSRSTGDGWLLGLSRRPRPRKRSRPDQRVCRRLAEERDPRGRKERSGHQGKLALEPATRGNLSRNAQPYRHPKTGFPAPHRTAAFGRPPLALPSSRSFSPIEAAPPGRIRLLRDIAPASSSVAA